MIEGNSTASFEPLLDPESVKSVSPTTTVATAALSTAPSQETPALAENRRVSPLKDLFMKQGRKMAYALSIVILVVVIIAAIVLGSIPLFAFWLFLVSAYMFYAYFITAGKSKEDDKLTILQQPYGLSGANFADEYHFGGQNKAARISEEME
jgi:hypothetical protein